MILTRNHVLKLMEEGVLAIDPFLPECLGPSSYDLALGNEFRTFKKVTRIVETTEDVDYRALTDLITVPDGERFLLMPGESAHAITRERLILPQDVCAWLQGRSTFARLGLVIHITASFVQPGCRNKQVLEMFNASPMPLAVRPGDRVCQVIFQSCSGRAEYRGRYEDQKL
jgi:dCTP deaminase